MCSVSVVVNNVEVNLTPELIPLDMAVSFAMCIARHTDGAEVTIYDEETQEMLRAS